MPNNILSDLIITDIISATTIYTEAGEKTHRHNRSAWAFAFKFEGETEYTSNAASFISDSHSLILLPCGSDYEWICKKAGHCVIIDFECMHTCNEIFSFKLSNPEKMLSKLRELEYKLNLRSSMYRQECIKDIYEIMLSLSKEKAYTPSTKSEKLQPAIDYIAKNYAKPIRNDQLACLCDLSTVYFRKLFVEIFSVPPINYIHTLRIQKAKEMLASDFGSISAIALSLGYANIYDFSRVFKKHTGISPSKYKHKI